MRKDILSALKDHRIDFSKIKEEKTKEYLMHFKRFSTERVLKSITNELTENDMWSVKGEQMGDCWHRDCCPVISKGKTRCIVDSGKSGKDKIMELLTDKTTRRIVKNIECPVQDRSR